MIEFLVTGGVCEYGAPGFGAGRGPPSATWAPGQGWPGSIVGKWQASSW
jgi:hypothetical protein